MSLEIFVLSNVEKYRRGQIKRRLLGMVRVRSSLRASKFYGQATKGARWMPWQIQAMKDVASCDKLREAATGVDPEISEWGNPPW